MRWLCTAARQRTLGVMDEEELAAAMDDAAERCAHGGWLDDLDAGGWEPLDPEVSRSRRDVLC